MKKITIIATALALATLGMTGVEAADANTSNSEYNFAVSQNDSSFSRTGYRVKYNNSSVYITTIGTTAKSFVIQVYGAKNNRGQSEKNCGKNYKSKVFYPDKKYYYATTVDGSSYTHVGLRIGGHGGYGIAKGVWSPDNTSNIKVDK